MAWQTWSRGENSLGMQPLLPVLFRVHNWILMSCQTHWVTSGQSNLGHKQMHISELILIRTLCQVNPQNQSLCKYKTKHTCIHKHKEHIFEVSPFSITLVKRAHRARTCWSHRPFWLIYQCQIEERKKIYIYI